MFVKASPRDCLVAGCQSYTCSLMGEYRRGDLCYEHNICGACGSKTGWKLFICYDCELHPKAETHHLCDLNEECHPQLKVETYSLTGEKGSTQKRARQEFHDIEEVEKNKKLKEDPETHYLDNRRLRSDVEDNQSCKKLRVCHDYRGERVLIN